MPPSAPQPAWIDSSSRHEGRYIIGPLLGHGGMGEVYEAWDTVLARSVALKILRHLEPAAMIRFMQEAQLHARLDCPNICRIYDVDACNGAPRIAMQLVRGPNLEDAAPDLRLDEILAIIVRVAQALHSAHQLQLIHRDIKPSNILLQWSESGGWVPYLCDFGLAMALDGPSVTQPLAMTGTPAYMAPEQVRGDRNQICPATDVYGVGSTLYFVLTGRPPCVSTVTSEVLRVKRERRFPSPRTLEPEIPADLETILLKCLQPVPSDRYASTQDLADDLIRFQSGQSIQAQPLRLGPRLWKRAQQHALALAAGAAGLTLVLGLLAWQRGTQNRQARLAELGHYFTQEAANLEQNLRNERMLPVHDLRPAFAQIRARMEALRSRESVLGSEAQGPLHYALGRAQFFIHDYPAAGRELAAAWASGYHSPEVAYLLARLRCMNLLQERDQARFQLAGSKPEPGKGLSQAEQLFHQARGLTCDPQEFTDALLAFSRGNYQQAMELARTSQSANPWHLDSTALLSLSQSTLATDLVNQDQEDQARFQYQAALSSARTGLTRGRSEESLHHAEALAALGLATLDQEEGRLSLEQLASLEHLTSQALELNPDDQALQSDWLRTRALKIVHLRALGRDPKPVLDQALQFFWTQTRQPFSVPLRIDRMVLYFQQAQWQQDHHQDPGPALAEALKDAGHAIGRHRDSFGELLNFKARMELAQGLDPRPTLAQVQGQTASDPSGKGSPAHWETACEAWRLQAQWERQSGLDPRASLAQAQALLDHSRRRDRHSFASLLHPQPGPNR